MKLKYKDFFLELTQTDDVGEIGYLWPFSKTELQADKWENTRLKNVLKTSLKGWKDVRFIHDDEDVNNDIRLKRGGDSNKPMYKDYTVVSKGYSPSDVDIYPNDRFQPDELKSKSRIVGWKK